MAESPAPVRPDRPTVAVVGGGIAGLAAAWELSGGSGRADPATPVVVVIVQLFPAGAAMAPRPARTTLRREMPEPSTMLADACSTSMEFLMKMFFSER